MHNNFIISLITRELILDERIYHILNYIFFDNAASHQCDRVNKKLIHAINKSIDKLHVILNDRSCIDDVKIRQAA